MLFGVRRPSWSTRRLWLALGLAFPPAGYASVALVAAHLLTQPSNAPATLDPRLVSRAAQTWETRAEDGVTLRGWYFPTPERRHLIVCVHGMQANWSELAGVGHDLHRAGYDVLLFDLRGHGRSDPSRLSMGRYERRDLRAVLQWAKAQGFAADRIGWIGYSLGAATVLMEGAFNPEIHAAVLDSPFGDLPELLQSQLAAHSGLPVLFNPGILMAARLAYGIRTDDLVPSRVAHYWQGRPLMVIHGEADSIVPSRHSLAIAQQAGPSCTVFFLPGVEHVSAYQVHRGWYVSALDEFFRENLAP